MSEQKRILLIEDDVDFRAMMTELLETGDYLVVEAENSEAALAIAAVEIFDLAITDLLMPGEGGFKFIRKMRQLQPNAYIIAMSGGSDQTNVDECLFLAGRYRADALLKKPFGMKELIMKIKEFIG